MLQNVTEMSLNESHVEAAALEWFEELGYVVGHGPDIVPCEPAQGLGTSVEGTWFWYESWLEQVREHCKANAQHFK